MVNEEILLDRSDETFLVDCIIYRELVQSVICSSRRVFCLKKVSGVIVNFHLLLWDFSAEKLETSTVVAGDSGFFEETFKAIWCSRKQKILPSRPCSKSGPDKSFLLRSTP